MTENWLSEIDIEMNKFWKTWGTKTPISAVSLHHSAGHEEREERESQWEQEEGEEWEKEQRDPQ